MSEARGHHFISQCYLRGFTRNGSKKSKLYVVSLAEHKTFESVPGGVAKIRDFNRAEGLPAGEVERMLAGFEGAIATALKRICADRSLDATAAWEEVLYLVALFAVRHPVQRQKTQATAELAAKTVLDLLTADEESWNSYQRIAREHGRINTEEDFFSLADGRAFAAGYTVELPTSYHIGLELMVLEHVLKTLVERKWTLCIAGPEAGNFVTSDRPVTLVHSDGATAGPDRQLAHGIPGTDLYFPIDRRLMAIGRFEGPSEVRTLDAESVAALNSITFANAHREVYCADRKDRLMHEGKMLHAQDVLGLHRPTARA
ncbi:DUF4238 domain-containing protein [Variovorax sp. EL159]|uniref:DUF4238 domain-containing protein n=1 Tax=Variovorax sp. EL159 TaxID=1566270 RepID=UPI00088CD14A|nr:DUF4238 domain-containing protein [Variovorax sp. EL159]SCX52980.1 Protein of unknown function [Variovorax sp. EL159]